METLTRNSKGDCRLEGPISPSLNDPVNGLHRSLPRRGTLVYGGAIQTVKEQSSLSLPLALPAIPPPATRSAAAIPAPETAGCQKRSSRFSFRNSRRKTVFGLGSDRATQMRARHLEDIDGALAGPHSPDRTNRHLGRAGPRIHPLIPQHDPLGCSHHQTVEIHRPAKTPPGPLFPQRFTQHLQSRKGAQPGLGTAHQCRNPLKESSAFHSNCALERAGTTQAETQKSPRKRDVDGLSSLGGHHRFEGGRLPFPGQTITASNRSSQTHFGQWSFRSTCLVLLSLGKNPHSVPATFSLASAPGTAPPFAIFAISSHKSPPSPRRQPFNSEDCSLLTQLA